MTRDKENLARAEGEVKQLREKVTSLQEELQKANMKLNVFDKVEIISKIICINQFPFSLSLFENL